MTYGNDDEIYDQAALIRFLPKEFKSTKPLFEGSEFGLLIPHNDGRKAPKMVYFIKDATFDAELNKQTT